MLLLKKAVISVSSFRPVVFVLCAEEDMKLDVSKSGEIHVYRLPHFAQIRPVEMTLERISLEDITYDKTLAMLY